jgi:hypothetical protein
MTTRDTAPTAAGLRGADWFKSSFSNDQGGCLEVAFLGDGRVALRDNEDLHKPPLRRDTPRLAMLARRGQERRVRPTSLKQRRSTD